MVLYRCPNCGRTIEAPPGIYSCRICGPAYIMVPAEKPSAKTCEEVSIPKEVKTFKGWIWSFYHAVEERDWERALKPFDWPRFREDVEKVRKFFHGRYYPLDAYIDELKEAIKRRDSERAFRIMAEMLLCLEPTVPMH
jgi:DNA-directed RNA polymerase subunit RPC12/RpoP